jgi:AraC family transcriptional regulator
LRTAVRFQPSAKPRYVERVNLAIDCVIEQLTRVSRSGASGKVRLSDAARAAAMSPYHFHRVFQAITGETFADFVLRLRLERAAAMMAFGSSRKVSLTTVARRCGFASSSDFSRAFKRKFGAPPSRFDLKAWRAGHAERLESLVFGADGEVRERQAHVRRLPGAANPDRFSVRIRDFPARAAAYIRVRDPYSGTGVVDALHRLMAWAKRRSLEGGQWLGYQWENPEITPLEQCVYHVAVEAPWSAIAPRGEVGRTRFPAMTVAQVEIRGSIELELRALQWLYGVWLPRSGYVPDDQPGFEAWIGMPFAHGMEHFELYIQLPIRRA